MKTTYKNRYGDEFTFTLQKDGNILWEGNFEYVRIGMPNDYREAYNQYLHDNKHNKDTMSFNEFTKEVHSWDDETHKYIYDKYLKLVKSVPDKISMVDPSGGPYITLGMDLNSFGFKDSAVQDFVKQNNNYLIITKKI
jgi:hypothetical protein